MDAPLPLVKRTVCARSEAVRQAAPGATVGIGPGEATATAADPPLPQPAAPTSNAITTTKPDPQRHRPCVTSA